MAHAGYSAPAVADGAGSADEAQLESVAHTLGATADPAMERPALAEGVALAGELQGTAFKDSQWLIVRDSRFLQVSELLYRVAERANGTRTLEEIAERVTDSTDWLVTAENVRQIIERKLMPLGVIAQPDEAEDGGSPIFQPSGPAAASLNMRGEVIGPSVIDPVARVLQFLYAPYILVPMLAVFILAQVWLFTRVSLLVSFASVLRDPVLSLVVVGILLVAGIVHEFGHASALRYGGGRARGMGVGLFLIYPAFYTDTTEAYRLGRWARVRTDLGGFYFHLIFALGLIHLYLATHWVFLPIAAAAIDLDIVRQLIPFVRLDGYWAVADLTGVPDLFSHVGPFIASLRRRGRGREAEGPGAMRGWARVVFMVYLGLTIPLLVLVGAMFVKSMPAMVHTMWQSLQAQAQSASVAYGRGQHARLALAVIAMLLLQLELFGVGFVLYVQGRQLGRALWSWGRPTAARRAAAFGVGVVVLAGLAYAWAPGLLSLLPHR